jgi:hypothetical protein
MSPKILQFVSRSEQLRLRGMRNFSHWHSITKGLEPFGPAERHRLFLQQAVDEATARGRCDTRRGRVKRY